MEIINLQLKQYTKEELKDKELCESEFKALIDEIKPMATEMGFKHLDPTDVKIMLAKRLSDKGLLTTNTLVVIVNNYKELLMAALFKEMGLMNENNQSQTQSL